MDIGSTSLSGWYEGVQEFFLPLLILQVAPSGAGRGAWFLAGLYKAYGYLLQECGDKQALRSPGSGSEVSLRIRQPVDLESGSFVDRFTGCEGARPLSCVHSSWRLGQCCDH
jgi:hypothetical protein